MVYDYRGFRFKLLVLNSFHEFVGVESVIYGKHGWSWWCFTTVRSVGGSVDKFIP